MEAGPAPLTDNYGKVPPSENTTIVSQCFRTKSKPKMTIRTTNMKHRSNIRIEVEKTKEKVSVPSGLI